MGRNQGREEMNINELAIAIYRDALIKGWHTPKEEENQFIEMTCNNLHDEVSELHEAWRSNELHALCDKSDKMVTAGIRPLTCLEEELADILIRALEACAFQGVEPEDIISRKMAYNRTRPHRHGGKKS